MPILCQIIRRPFSTEN